MTRNPRIRLSSDSSAAKQDVQDWGRVTRTEVAAADLAFRTFALALGASAVGLKTVGGAAAAANNPILGMLNMIRLITPRVVALSGALLTVGAASTLAYIEFNKSVAALGDNADALGVTADQYQAIERRAIRLGTSMEELRDGLQNARESFFDAERGAGSFQGTLKQMAPDVLEAVNAQETQTEKLNAFLVALEDYPNKMDRARIAQAAFGENGLQIVEVLESEEGGLERLSAAYAGTATIVNTETVRMAQELDREWEELLNRMSANFDGFKRTLRVGVLEIVDAVTSSRGDTLQAGVDQAQEELSFSIEQVALASRRLAQLRDEGIDSPEVGNLEREIAFYRSQVEQINARVMERQRELDEYLNGAEEPESRLRGPEDEEDEAEARRRAAERRRLEAEAAALLVQQNDITRATALEAERLNDIREAGLITDEQYAEALEQAKISLLEQTPFMQANAEKARELEASAKAYADEQARAAAELERQEAALQAALESSADRLILRNETPGARRARQIAEARELFEASARGDIETNIDSGTLARELEAIEELYQRATEQSSAFRDTQFEIEDALYALIDPAADFESAWRSAARTFINEFLGVEDSIVGIARTLRGLLPGQSGGGGGILAGLGSIFGGGGPSGVGTPGIVPEFHDGGLIGSPTRFRDLGRNPLMPHESLIVARKDERVVKPGQFSGGGFHVSIHAEGADRAGLEGVRQEVAALRQAVAGSEAGFGDRVEQHLGRIQSERGRLV